MGLSGVDGDMLHALLNHKQKTILNMKWPMFSFKDQNVSSILLKNMMHVKMQLHLN